MLPEGPGWSIEEVGKVHAGLQAQEGHTHNDYLKTLEQQNQSTVRMRLLLSKNHQVKLSEMTVRLSACDDQRFVTGYGRTTLVHNHMKMLHHQAAVKKICTIREEAEN